MPEWTIIFTVVPRVASQWGMCHVAVSHATCASCKPSWDLAGDMKSSLNGTSMLNTTPGIPLLGLVPCVCLLLLLTLELTAAAADSPRSHPGGYSALCVVGKDENLYVREWVEYHKCLGGCSTRMQYCVISSRSACTHASMRARFSCSSPVMHALLQLMPKPFRSWRLIFTLCRLL